MSGYARPELLAETEWLAAHLDDPAVRIVDCDEPAAYRRAHIPGAVALPVHHYLKDPQRPDHVMGSETFAQVMGSLGIGDDTTVVAYDNEGGHFACRLWWALDLYGHTKAKVLNGGLTKWLREGRTVSDRAPTVEPARFQVRPGADGLCTLDYLKGALGRPEVVVWDVRSPAEHTGAERRENRYGGHIPGAVNLEWRNLISDDEYRVWKPARELKRMLASLGITPDRDVICH
jgi:thiosulfate/3-mercaptopyruvate sulfurtransferase